jgi:hypothetical protein
VQSQKIEIKTDTDSQGKGFPEYAQSDGSEQRRDQSFFVFLKHFFHPKNWEKFGLFGFPL